MFTRIRFPRFLAAALAAVALSTAVVQPASAQAFSDYAENVIVDRLVRGQATPAFPTTWYVALFTGAGCDDTNTFTNEVANSNGYARASFTANMTNWDGTQGGNVTVASSGTGGQTKNNVAITFGTPSGAGWGTVTYWALTDNATRGAGNIWVCAALTASKTINSGDTVSFAINALTITVQ